jgi:hypothetical protein
MRIANQYNGFISFDALLSIVPIVLMTLFLLNLSALITKSASEKIHRQQTFDKLVSIADYTVKIGAVKRVDDMRYPNWIEAKAITGTYVEDLRNRADLPELYISTKEPDGDFQICIYRLAVVDDDKKISRLFVCGG